jgi:hypothetical protein
MGRLNLSAALLVFTLIFAAPPAFAASKTSAPKAQPGRVMEPKDFDRLDGHGPTAKKVDVIEWEGNLEIHVYPKGSLKSLAMKIDHESKATKNNVMVIEYGFTGVAYTLIRRAILSIPMPDTFKAFKDETADDYDKIIISGSSIDGAKAYALAPGPVQMYPDYSDALAQTDDDSAAPKTGVPAKTYERKRNLEGATPAPASVSDSDENAGIQFQKADELGPNGTGTTRRRRPAPTTVDEDGGIRNFAF